MFWAYTATREPRVESTIAASAVNGGQIATSTPSPIETRGSSACDELARPLRPSCASSSCRRSAALRLTRERLHAGQLLALDQLERRAAAGRQVRDPVRQAEPRRAPRRSRRRRRPSSPAPPRPPRATARVPAANGSSSNAPIGPFQNTVPAPRDLLARSAAAVRGPMSSPIQPSGTSTPSSVAASALGADAARRARGPRAARARPRGRRRRRSAHARASSTSSSAHSEAPMAWPCAARNGKHIAPPIRIASASSRKRSMTPILSRHLGAAEDRHQRPRRLGQQRGQRRSTSRSSSRPAALVVDQSRDALGRGVRAVRGAEGVVDVDVGERGERSTPARGRSWSRRARSGRSRAAAPRPAPAPRLQLRTSSPTTCRRQRHVAPQSARRAGRATGAHRQLGLAVLRPPEMGDEDELARRARAAPRSSAAPRGCACRRRTSPSSSGTLKSTRTRTRLPSNSPRSASVSHSSRCTRSTTRFE